MFSEKTHRYIYLFGLISLAFGIMMGSVPTSVPQFILVINWLVEGKLNEKWQSLRTNKLFWILGSVFFIHVFGMFYTEDFRAGVDDLRIKMPLLLLPIVFFGSKPLSLREFRIFLYFFVAGSVCNTAWCLVYNFVLHQNEIGRNASRFMSHIRLGLYLNMVIATCVYFIYTSKNFPEKLFMAFLILYFMYVLYALGLATGIINFILLLILVSFYFIYKQKFLIKLLSLLFILGLIFFVSRYVIKIRDAQLEVKNVESNTIKRSSPSGRLYLHLEENGQKENGYFILINIQPDELQKEWKHRFPADSFNFDQKYNLQRFEILVRYLASKGLTKDSLALTTLSEEDFQNIQKGHVNYNYSSWSFLHKRIYEFVNEYDEFKNDRYINGHSLTMRLYFWKAAIECIKKNLLFGCGTGDVQTELNKVYKETNSPLNEEWYKRPHNQFLTITVALGIVGLLISLIGFFYPIIKYRKYLPVLALPFIFLAFGSFMMEDTLETQAGLSFYAVFSSLFYAMAYDKNHLEEN